ncbi:MULTISPECIES: DUF1507 family protein [unclassified Gemella]|uniref:DUF1507 family protein n=1 Tax=unclassified Gemella TaxID=2624949 RepID=UPI001C048CEF|nr:MULTISPECIES: DUF1507 family protein [unclassified Gemella]MBU0278278.1 YlaN family protein [Gemella sp. zg-1178]QWQ38215.1 YlaN family protein [Gemella sp. zg-570]
MDNILKIKVINKIRQDIKKVEELIEAQLSVKKYRECPLYQDVIDTQIYGISKELELAVEIGFVTKSYSKEVLEDLENKLNNLYLNIEKRKIN